MRGVLSLAMLACLLAALPLHAQTTTLPVTPGTVQAAPSMQTLPAVPTLQQPLPAANGPATATMVPAQPAPAASRPVAVPLSEFETYVRGLAERRRFAASASNS